MRDACERFDGTDLDGFVFAFWGEAATNTGPPALLWLQVVGCICGLTMPGADFAAPSNRGAARVTSLATEWPIGFQSARFMRSAAICAAVVHRGSDISAHGPQREARQVTVPLLL